MFTPKLEITGNNDATEIEIFDISGVLSGTNNPNGWGTISYCSTDKGTLEVSDITSIIVNIYLSGTTTLVQSINIPVTELPSIPTDEFSLGTYAFTTSYGSYEAEIQYSTLECDLLSDKIEFEFISDEQIIGEPNPKGNLKICLLQSCNILNITEKTLSTTTCPDNPNGWTINPGTYGYTATPIKKLYIDVFDSSNNLVDTIIIVENDINYDTSTITNITNNFENPHIGEFELPNHTWLQEDGYYKFMYRLEVDREFQPSFVIELSTNEHFFYCKAQKCVNDLWVKYVSTCSCSDEEYKKLEEKTLQAQILLDGVKTSIGCMNTSDADEIVKTLNKICTLTNSDCGCN